MLFCSSLQSVWLLEYCYIQAQNFHPWYVHEGLCFQNFNMKNLLYVNGCPSTHGNITGLINSCRCSLFNANCLFNKKSNDKELFIKRKASKSIVVHAVCISSLGGELINYKFHILPIVHQRQLPLGLPLCFPLGCKKTIIM